MSGADGAARLTDADRRHGQMLDGVLLFHEVAVGRILADHLAALTQDRDQWQSVAATCGRLRNETIAERDEARAVVEAVRARGRALADEWEQRYGDDSIDREIAELRALLLEPETNERSAP